MIMIFRGVNNNKDVLLEQQNYDTKNVITLKMGN